MKNILKVKEVISILEGQGFSLERRKGSHRHFKGEVGGKARLVTVAGKDSEDIPQGTLKAIIRQSALPREAFRRSRRS